MVAVAVPVQKQTRQLKHQQGRMMAVAENVLIVRLDGMIGTALNTTVHGMHRAIGVVSMVVFQITQTRAKLQVKHVAHVVVDQQEEEEVVVVVMATVLF